MSEATSTRYTDLRLVTVSRWKPGPVILEGTYRQREGKRPTEMEPVGILGIQLLLGNVGIFYRI